MHAELVLQSWRPMADWAVALGATYWVLVPCTLRPVADALVRHAGVDLRMAGYRLDSDGNVEIEW